MIDQYLTGRRSYEWYYILLSMFDLTLGLRLVLAYDLLSLQSSAQLLERSLFSRLVADRRRLVKSETAGSDLAAGGQ